MTGSLSTSFIGQVRSWVLGSALVAAAALAPTGLTVQALAGSGTLNPAGGILAPQDEAQPSADNSAVSEEPTIAFAYNGEDWEQVIDDFVGQTKLTLYPYSDYPEGTFTYPDGEKRSLKEALDILNRNLQLQGYVLIRFGNQLILINHVEDGFPAQLIEQVRPEDLDNRGSFDLVYTRFDVSGLDIEEISDQIEGLIDAQRGEMKPIQIANELRVRENVRVLLTIRDVIDKAKAANKVTFRVKNLKHVPFETLMRVMRPRFGLDEESNRSRDGKLAVSLGLGETQMLVTGASTRVDAFMDFADQVDIEDFAPPAQAVEEEILRSYSPKTDPALVDRIIRSQFEGRPDMRISLGEESGVIYVQGRKADHDRINEIIAAIEADGMQVEVIQCSELDTDEMVERIKLAMGIATGLLSEEDSGGKDRKLYFVEDSYNDQVIVRGTLPLVTEAKKLAEVFDPVKPRGAKETRPYLTLETSDLKDTEIDAALEQFELIWGSVDRPNTIDIVQPSERINTLDGPAAEQAIRFPSYKRETGKTIDLDNMTPDELNKLRRMMQEAAQMESERSKEEDSKPTADDKIDAAWHPVKRDALVISIEPIVAAFQESAVEGTVGDEEDSAASNQDAPMANVFKNVPGAPVVIERLPDGRIMLRSDDREALGVASDILNDLLNSNIVDVELESSKLTTFLIGYRAAEEIAVEIEEILGLESSGGGGGGLGGMVGNMAQNAVGGAAGDMLGGLLGGGLDGGSSSSLTSGEVTIHVDNFLNALLVYANDTDLAQIEALIELKDRPEAYHDPMINGQIKTIAIKHRDPEVIKTLVESQFADYIKKDAAPGQGGNQPNPAELIKQMMQGGGRRGGASAEPAKPKLAVAVDAQAKLLVVKGPNYVLDQIETFVSDLDFPGAVPEKRMIAMPIPPGMNIEMLKALSGTQSTTPTPGGSSANRTPTPGGATPTPTPNFSLPSNFNFGGARPGGSSRGGRGGDSGGGNRGGGGRGGRGG